MRNKLCTFAVTAVFTLGMAGSALLAQDSAAPPPSGNSTVQGHHRMSPDAQLQRMTRRLDLSAGQQAQIKPILESRQQQMQQLREDQSMSPQERQQKRIAIQQDTHQKIEAVLNDTQKQKFEAMHERMKQRRMERQQKEQAPSQDSAPPSPQQ